MALRLLKVTMVLCGLALGANAQTDPPSTGNILEDARLIITSNKGEVRIWHRAPRVVILTDDPEVTRSIEAIFQTLEDAINPGYGEVLFGPITTRPFPQNFGHGSQRLAFRMRQVVDGKTDVTLNLGDGDVLKTDLVIAVGNRPNIAMLNGLWGMPSNFTRAQMSGGRARCFYSSRSKNGFRLGAYVSVVGHGQFSQDTAECLWEEILHAMGPLIDAKGSPFFTFDNEIGSTALKKQNDVLLLRALYESGTVPGGGPEKTLTMFADLLSQRDTQSK